MSALPIRFPLPQRLGVYGRRLSNTRAVGPAIVLALLFALYVALEPSVLSAFQFNAVVNVGAVVAIAAAGQAIIVIGGGFDLSVGSLLSLVNVVVVREMTDHGGPISLMVVLGLAVGALAGLVNGALVVLAKIPSIIATLAMSFLWGGVALLVMSQPGGTVSTTFALAFTGNVGAWLPAVLILLALVGALWLVLKRTRFGRALYAIGGDRGAAIAAGIRVGSVSIAGYVIAGLLYGLAGVVLTAESASGDPNVGTPLLLTVFAAVVIGGVAFGGGRGDLIGAMIGAYIIYLVANILFVLGVTASYTDIVNGAVLLLAVLLTSLGAMRGDLTRWLRERAPLMLLAGGVGGRREADR